MTTPGAADRDGSVLDYCRLKRHYNSDTGLRFNMDFLRVFSSEIIEIS